MTIPIEDVRARVARAAYEWTDADVRRLYALVSLGTPSALADGSACEGITATHDTDPGDVPAMRPTLSTRAAAQADALHVWRVVGALEGVPLPVPGARNGGAR